MPALILSRCSNVKIAQSISSLRLSSSFSSIVHFSTHTQTLHLREHSLYSNKSKSQKGIPDEWENVRCKIIVTVLHKIHARGFNCYGNHRTFNSHSIPSKLCPKPEVWLSESMSQLTQQLAVVSHHLWYREKSYYSHITWLLMKLSLIRKVTLLSFNNLTHKQETLTETTGTCVVVVDIQNLSQILRGSIMKEETGHWDERNPSCTSPHLTYL